MFRNLYRKYKVNKEARAFLASPFGQILKDYNQSFLELVPHAAGETIEGYTKALMESLARIAAAENQFAQFREELAEHVCELADCQVLCLTESEKAEDYGDVPYLSGQLHYHVEECVEENSFLKELIWRTDGQFDGQPLTAKDLVSALNSRCLRMNYIVNGLNRVRHHLGDYVEGKDWLQPFLRAMLIWSEDNYRSKLGMDSLFESDDDILSLNGLRYSAFLNRVVDCDSNPFMTWEDSWKDMRGDAKHYLNPPKS